MTEPPSTGNIDHPQQQPPLALQSSVAGSPHKSSQSQSSVSQQQHLELQHAAPQQPCSPADEKDRAPCRVDITDAELIALSPSELALRWRLQDSYIHSVENRIIQLEGELLEVQTSSGRQRAQLADSQQRERVLVRRLAAKEQEMQDLVCQLNELKAQLPGIAAAAAAPPGTTTIIGGVAMSNNGGPAGVTPPSQLPGSAAGGTNTSALLRTTTLLDPAVNALHQLLGAELRATRARLEDAQHELTAWKFTPDSNTGKRLMTKCRLLHQENEELGRLTHSGRIATLEGDLALQRSYSEEVRTSQSELESFLADFEEDLEGMQSTIMLLQQELRKGRDQVLALERENTALRSSSGGGSGAQNGGGGGSSALAASTGRSHSDVSNSAAVIQQNGVVSTSPVISTPKTASDCASSGALLLSNGDVAMATSTIIATPTTPVSASSIAAAVVTAPAATTTPLVAGAVTAVVITRDFKAACGDNKGATAVVTAAHAQCNGGERDSTIVSTQQPAAKRMRRSSVLSIDYNEESPDDDDDDDDEDGMLVINGDVGMSDAD